MKEIKLTQGKVALVDDEDFEYLNQWKWFAHKEGRTYYAHREIHTEKCKRYILKMHHVITGIPPANLLCDHRDGNGLNNQRNNLRLVTKRQNAQNLQYSKSSQYPGVCKYRNGWITRIRINGKRKYLGGFKTEIEAFNAYKNAVEKIGEKVLCQ